MKKFFIITNESKDPDKKVTKEVIDFIESSGNIVTGNAISLSDKDSGGYLELAKTISKDTECIIVLGGDGTMLRAARHLYTLDIPFIGINLGHLGYLTEGRERDIENIFDKVFRDEFEIEERMLISGHKEGQDAPSQKQIALNDITLTRNNSLKIISFNLYVNGALLYTYRADGIVVSTPTGSTAYNLSLGGPIATPTSRLILITPIAPHSLNNRSLVLSPNDKLEIELVGCESDKPIEYLVFYDGDESFNINPGDRIRVEAEDKVVKLLRLSPESFLKTLKEKMS